MAGLLLLLLLTSPDYVVLVLNRDALRHVVDLVHTHQSSSQLEHVVSK